MGAFTGFIKEHALAADLQVSVWTLRAWRKRGYGPSSGKVGRTVVYSRADVDQFLASRLSEGAEQ